MNMDDYKSENCHIRYLSDLEGYEAEKMIGKTVSKVYADEYVTRITFTDGSSIECSGHRWDDCAMGAEYNDA